MESANADAAQCATRLRTAVFFLGRWLRPNVHRSGLSAGKLSVLGQLYRFGPGTPSEIAGREGVKLQTLTRLLADLEAEGWVLREAHATDGRQSVLSITRHGLMRLANEVREREAGLASVIESALSADERARLLDACSLLDRICQAYEADVRRTS
jgi:DNA-binding MarR family transcriptional regulator